MCDTEQMNKNGVVVVVVVSLTALNKHTHTIQFTSALSQVVGSLVHLCGILSYIFLVFIKFREWLPRVHFCESLKRSVFGSLSSKFCICSSFTACGLAAKGTHEDIFISLWSSKSDGDLLLKSTTQLFLLVI